MKRKCSVFLKEENCIFCREAAGEKIKLGLFANMCNYHYTLYKLSFKK